MCSEVHKKNIEKIRKYGRVAREDIFKRLLMQYKHGRLLARGAGAGFMFRVTTVCLGFFVHLLLARWLDARGYGDYAFAVASIELLILFGLMGFRGAAIRFTATYCGNAEWSLMRGFLRTGAAVVLAACLVIGAGGAAILLLFSDRLRPALIYTLLFSFFLLPFAGLLHFVSGVLQGLKRIIEARLPLDMMQQALLIIGFLVLTGIAGFQPTGYLAMGVLAAATGLALVAAYIFTARSLPAEISEVRAEYRIRTWMGAAVTLLLLGSFHRVLNQADILMLGMLRGTEQAGLYNVAVRVTGLIAFPLTSANMIAAPLFAELHSSGEKRDLQQHLTLVCRGIVLFTLPIAAVVIAAGTWLLGLFGESFRAGYIPLVILTGGQLTSALFGPVSLLLTMTGHQVRAAWIVGGAAFLNIGLNGILIPLFGIQGAAAASAGTLILWNTLLWVVVKRNVDVYSGPIYWKKR